MTFPIETERLRIRPLTREDTEPLRAVYAEPEVARWIGPEMAQDMARSIAEQMALQATRGFSMFAVQDRATGALLGDCGLQPLDLKGPEIEIGWTLTRAAWGRGCATEAARAVLPHAFATWGLDRVIAVIKHDNIASLRVAEKLGMADEGERHAYGELLRFYAAYP